MIFEGKRILVTGGTGSMGKTFVHRALSGELGTPKKVIVFSRDEAKQHEMRLAFQHKTRTTDEVIYRNFMQVLEFRIGDVRDYGAVCSAVKRADIVVNAAALKQVPSCEYFPGEAVLTNCIGAHNIVRAIEENDYPVETVVAISTDKACKPVNVMGMTKSLQERIFVAANILNTKTRFIGVRYGNVLASRGSVIPLFHEQIGLGGPVTITSPQMTRFLLSLNRAVDTVFAALRQARPGEIYVPNVPSATVMNLAKALIGKRKIAIKITGIRPGEKLHEIMVSEEEVNHCVKRGEYYVIKSMLPELNTGKRETNALKKEFSSADSVIGYPATAKLLKQHHLTVEDMAGVEDGELLR
ncbi:MAG: polysaccharide biosynthesis protein [Betaproteobacteria bacterium RIFCSPLOWO2_12_FULL_62_13]|nr:MAG: polysaccharide biosynthesis protein [Betaproteobacteria bacterium RIFCSPLOWO2_12_FULL_62_13]